MTFKRFEEIFLSKNPGGMVVAHGQFGGTERNNKTTVVFRDGGKTYSYYGAYEDVLCKMGINTISKERLESLQKQLARLQEENGKEEENLFFDDDEPWIIDWSREIAELEARLDDIKKNYIIA